MATKGEPEGRGQRPRPVLVFDGACSLCNRSVEFIRRRARRATLEFAPRDGEFAAALLSRHPAAAQVDSIIWVEPAGDGRAEYVLVRSDAVLAVARHLAWPWRLFGAARLLPRRWRDAAYDLVARHRGHQTVEARPPRASTGEPGARSGE